MLRTSRRRDGLQTATWPQSPPVKIVAAFDQDVSGMQLAGRVLYPFSGDSDVAIILFVYSALWDTAVFMAFRDAASMPLRTDACDDLSTKLKPVYIGQCRVA